MKRRSIFSVGGAIVAASFMTGFLFNGTFMHSSPSLASAAPATTGALTASTSVDRLTETAYRSISRSVVFINNASSGTGSGIVYDTSGDIVTNAHVTSGGTHFTVTFAGGRTVPATLVGSDPEDDLAVIHVQTKGLHPATFAKSSSYAVAETVLAVGSPIGLKNSVTEGLISGLHRTEQEPNGAYIPDAIQTSAAINPGNSGGALATLNGQIAGITTMVQTSTTGNEPVQNVGFAIPSSRVTFIAHQIVSSGHVTHTGRPFLGASLGDESTQNYGYFGGSGSASGALLNSVKTGGPAGRAGLQAGDIITRFNGERVTSSNDLLGALAHLRPGSRVTATYLRNGSSHNTTTIVLGELPASA